VGRVGWFYTHFWGLRRWSGGMFVCETGVGEGLRGGGGYKLSFVFGYEE